MEYITSNVTSKRINNFRKIEVVLRSYDEDFIVAYVEYVHRGGKKNGTPQDDLWIVQGRGEDGLDEFNQYGLCDSYTAVKEINNYMKNAIRYFNEMDCSLEITGYTANELKGEKTTAHKATSRKTAVRKPSTRKPATRKPATRRPARK